jgi:hypothetical protein
MTFGTLQVPVPYVYPIVDSASSLMFAVPQILKAGYYNGPSSGISTENMAGSVWFVCDCYNNAIDPHIFTKIVLVFLVARVLFRQPSHRFKQW